MIWFTSDLHAYHKNISGPTISEWKTGYRDFVDEIQMTNFFIEKINENVKDNDILYFLGDWSFGHPYNIKRFRDQINCKTIHFILGNHDSYIRTNKKFIIETGIIYAKDLFSSVQNTLSITHNNINIFLSHYSHRVWPTSHKGSIHLFGHSHGALQGIGKSMDVGIDNAKNILGEYRPFNIDEILILLNNDKN